MTPTAGWLRYRDRHGDEWLMIKVTKCDLCNSDCLSNERDGALCRRCRELLGLLP